MPVEFFSSVGIPTLKSVEFRVFTAKPLNHILVNNPSHILFSALTPVPNSYFSFSQQHRGCNQVPQGLDLAYRCILFGLDSVLRFGVCGQHLESERVDMRIQVWLGLEKPNI